jgi:hypothetical protein
MKMTEVEKESGAMTVSRQYALLEVSRSTLYYQSAGGGRESQSQAGAAADAGDGPRGNLYGAENVGQWAGS